MSMAGNSEPIGFEGEDNTIAPYVAIPWDKTIIKHNISLIKYDHITRMIHDSSGKLKGFIYVDEEDIVRWFAADEDYLE